MAEETNTPTPKPPKKKKKGGNAVNTKKHPEPKGNSKAPAKQTPEKIRSKKNSTPKNISADEWRLSPISYNNDGTENPAQLTFYREGKPLARMNATEDNVSDIIRELQARFHANTLVPTDWHVQPNDEGEPVLTFTTKFNILMSLPMNQRFLKTFTKTLQGYITVPEKPTTTLQRWWRRHKVARVFASALSLPIVVVVLLALGWAASHSY